MDLANYCNLEFWGYCYFQLARRAIKKNLVIPPRTITMIPFALSRVITPGHITRHSISCLRVLISDGPSVWCVYCCLASWFLTDWQVDKPMANARRIIDEETNMLEEWIETAASWGHTRGGVIIRTETRWGNNNNMLEGHSESKQRILRPQGGGMIRRWRVASYLYILKEEVIGEACVVYPIRYFSNTYRTA